MIFQTMSSVCFRGIEGEAVASAAAAAEVEGTRTSVISSNLPATHISLYCLSHRKWRGMTPVPVQHDSQRRRHKKAGNVVQERREEEHEESGEERVKMQSAPGFRVRNERVNTAAVQSAGTASTDKQRLKQGRPHPAAACSAHRAIRTGRRDAE